MIVQLYIIIVQLSKRASLGGLPRKLEFRNACEGGDDSMSTERVDGVDWPQRAPKDYLPRHQISDRPQHYNIGQIS